MILQYYYTPVCVRVVQQDKQSAMTWRKEMPRMPSVNETDEFFAPLFTSWVYYYAESSGRDWYSCRRRMKRVHRCVVSGKPGQEDASSSSFFRVFFLRSLMALELENKMREDDDGDGGQPDTKFRTLFMVALSKGRKFKLWVICTVLQFMCQ